MFVALEGADGCGKTTLCLILTLNHEAQKSSKHSEAEQRVIGTGRSLFIYTLKLL